MNAPTPNKRSCKWFFVFVTLLVFVIAGRYVWTTGHRAALSTQCHCHIFELGCCVLGYEASRGKLPPRVVYKDGVPMHSWRVLILPFLDEQALYDLYRFDEPWNGPNNSFVIRLKCLPATAFIGTRTAVASIAP